MVAIPATLKKTYEFACHSAACAPPSAGGTGGSLGKGKSGGGGGSAPSATGGPGSRGGNVATWAKRAGFPAHATGKGNTVTIKNDDGSVTKVIHAKNKQGQHKFDVVTTKDGYEVNKSYGGYQRGLTDAKNAARIAASHAAQDKSRTVKALEKDYGVRKEGADPNSLQTKYKGRGNGVRFPKDLATNAAGDIIIRPGGGYNPNAGAKLGTMSRQESGKGWQGTLEDGHVVKSKTRAGVIAATVRYIQK
jgi:hypothetical protein